MKFVFFTKGDRKIPSSRARAYLVADLLKTAGHDSEVYNLGMSPWWKFDSTRVKKFYELARIIKNINNENIVYLHKAIFQADFLIIILFFKIFLKKRFIFDFDDAIYIHMPRKTRILTKLADVVIVGSHALYEYAKKYNDNVYMIPTSVNINVYRKIETINKNSVITIGWVGSPGHYPNLKLLVPIFKNVLDMGFKFHFVLAGASNSNEIKKLFNKVGAEFIDSPDWGEPKKIVEIINRFDIGVMPLIDNERYRAKCAFKAVEYMACSVPVIASDVGEARYLINSEKNGILANNNDEWTKGIINLMSDPILRRKMGELGRATICDKYSYDKNIPKLISITGKYTWSK